MKKYFLIPILLTGLFSVSFSWADDGLYQNFETLAKGTGSICQMSKDDGGWYDKKEQLMTKTWFYFPVEDVNKKAENYFGYMKTLGISKDQVLWELGKIDFANGDEPLFVASDAFDLVRIAYRETMNNLYRCALINAKIITGKHIMETKPAEQSSIYKKLKKEETQLKSQLTKYKCRNTTDIKSPDPSVKIGLLNNTTYQYCVYRYYIESYLTKLDLKKFVPVGAKNTDALMNDVATKNIQIARESKRAQELYKLAFQSFSEFERTYELHLWLTVLYEDFINIRDNFKKLLNPIGQVVYKIVNAQSPK